MLSRWVRRWTPDLFHPLLSFLTRLGVTPNGLTLASLLLALVCGVFIALDQLLLAAGFLVFSGLLDALDGELARLIELTQPEKGPNRLGGFIDSVADHYGDFAIYLGLAYRAVNGQDFLTIFLVIIAMFGSLMGSHVRSRAGMSGVDTKNVGAFTRMERIVVLLAGLLTGWISPALAVLAAAANISALQRVVYTLKK